MLAYITRSFQLCWVPLDGAELQAGCVVSHSPPTERFQWVQDGRGIYYLERLASGYRQVRHADIATGATNNLTDGLADVRQLALSEDGGSLFFLAAAYAGPAVTEYDFWAALYRDSVPWTIHRLDLSAHARPATPVALTPLAASGRIATMQAGRGTLLNLTRNLDPMLLDRLNGRDHEDDTERPHYALNQFDWGSSKVLAREPTTTSSFEITAVRGHLMTGNNRNLEIRTTNVGSFGPATSIKISVANVTVDPRWERQQIFGEVWRMYRDYFHDEAMQGADWPALSTRYGRWVADVRHRSDLDFELRHLIGELGNSHLAIAAPDEDSSGFEPAGGPNAGVAMPEMFADECVGLLGADFEIDRGRYRVQRILTGSSWGSADERSPLAAPEVDVQVGEYLVEVSGQELRATDDLDRLLSGTAGKPVNLRVGAEPRLAGSRLVTVVPLASELGLRQRTWIEDNRRRVDEMSDGRIAYLHQPDTSGGGLAEFLRYFFPQAARNALLLDERFNGGGADVDYQLDVLSRQQVHWYTSRHLPPFVSPLSVMGDPRRCSSMPRRDRGATCSITSLNCVDWVS